MGSISSFLYRRIRRWMLVLATVVFVFFMIYVLPNEAVRSSSIVGDVPAPDTSLIYSSADLYAIAEAYGPEGRAYYVRSRYTFDVAWPLAYLFFLTTAITMLYNRLLLPKWLYLVNLMPLMGAGFDALENILAAVVMYRFPRPTPLLAALAPVATLLKWGSIAAAFAALLTGVVLLLVPAFRKG